MKIPKPRLRSLAGVGLVSAAVIFMAGCRKPAEPVAPAQVVLHLDLSAATGSERSPITALATVRKEGKERVVFVDDCCVIPPYFAVLNADGRYIFQTPVCDCLGQGHELGNEEVVSTWTWDGTGRIYDGTGNDVGHGQVPPGEYTVIASFQFRWTDRPLPNQETLEARAIVTWQGEEN